MSTGNYCDFHGLWKRDLKTRKVTKKPSNLCVLQHALFCSFTHLSCQRNGNAAVADVFLTIFTHPGKLWELLAMLVCKSQQLSCGLSGGFWFEEALIFCHLPPPQSSRESCSALWMCQPCSSPGQMPGVLEKIENCGDRRAEPKTTFGLILGIKITDTCCFPVCFGW